MAVENRIARNYARGVGALMVLPFLVNERGDDMFTKMTPGQEFAHPTLLYTGDSPMSSEAMCVKCEDVCVDVLDFTSGVVVLFSMYWAFNIEYVSSAKQTLSLLEHMMQIRTKTTKLGTKALKVLTALKARSAAATKKTAASVEQAVEQAEKAHQSLSVLGIHLAVST
ncbi:uncharacterized protein LOC142575221 [Dermacentor variabilis]|uniref:uncharacterized protein LOC142575221 n=1 Tax=Dermacentor variabilis TaxID=34621 RepID=UPI003F5C9CFD